MSARSLGFSLLAMITTAGLILPAVVPAQSGPQGRSWHEIAELPDWSGVWEFARGRGQVAAHDPKFTPRALAESAAYIEAQERGENLQTQVANCTPPGLLGSMRQPYPIEFLFTPGKVTIAIEAHSQMRRIYTDGRALPEDPDLLWQGNSIGRWEGDTLVVETVGLDPAAPNSGQAGAPGVTLSPKARVEERMRLIEDDVLEITTTIEDPETYLEPWTFSRHYERRPDWELREYICQENNRDAADAQGRPSMTFE